MPNSFLTQFAAETSGQSEGIFQALGIDWQMLLFQIIGFIVLVVLMGKFVYPILIRQVDARQKKIDDSVNAAKEAEKKAENAEANIEETMKTARAEAADIVSTAKDEAAQMLEKAETDARKRSERIVAEAQEDIDKQVTAAKKALEKETLGLVKRAASAATSNVADAKLDDALVKKSLAGVKE